MLSLSARCLGSLLAITWFVSCAAAYQLCTHDETFVPDAVLRVTASNITQSCLPSKLTVLVNGTAPGPEVRLTAGKTQWIRVYNDMTNLNLTMVSVVTLDDFQSGILS
jgi:hypothetical protein